MRLPEVNTQLRAPIGQGHVVTNGGLDGAYDWTTSRSINRGVLFTVVLRLSCAGDYFIRSRFS